MAAPSGTTWGSKVGDKGRIGLYTSLSSTNTQTTLEVQIWFWSKYSVSDSNNTLYYDNRSSSGSATTSKGDVTVKTTVATGSGWSTSNQKKLKTYTKTYDRKTSAQTRYLYAKLKNIDVVGGGAAMSVSKTVSIPKLASYAVSYNANGGSGAPAKQTKWYGNALTLSKTVPTRTGYTFQGWGTSTSDTSVDYKAGSSYTGNAALTLYAIWKINTWTVSYNANGGSGAPGNQTKTYGKTLVISTTKPTRTGYDFQGWGTSTSDASVDYKAGANYTANAAIKLYAIWKLKTYTVTFNPNGGTVTPTSLTKTHGVALDLTPIPIKPEYNFLGWATSAASTTVSYKAGSSYTSEAAITLYAVWELAYTPPRITNLKAVRCDADKNLVDDGTYALVSFDWEVDYSGNVSGGINAIQHDDGTSSIADFMSNIPNLYSDTEEFCFGYGRLSTDKSYEIIVSVSDGVGESTARITLPSMIFTIDMLGGGKGVAFGKVAEHENLADFAFQANFGGGIKNQVLEDNTDLNTITLPNVYAGNSASTNEYLNCPITTATSFVLEVATAGDEGQLMQRITTCTNVNPTTYERFYYAEAWGDWICISNFENKLLWSGGYYMSANHTVTLSEPISKQPNGIVLVFSAYSSSTVRDYHFNTHFISKYQVSVHGGCGHSFLMCDDANFSGFGAKYLYIHDDKIVGNDVNSETATAGTGITYNNAGWVLRYVIGV